LRRHWSWLVLWHPSVEKAKMRDRGGLKRIMQMKIWRKIRRSLLIKVALLIILYVHPSSPISDG
jgi:hypothetical protein